VIYVKTPTYRLSVSSVIVVTSSGYVVPASRKLPSKRLEMMDMKEEIITYKGRKLKVIEVETDGKSQEELEFEKWSDSKYCLEAVKRNGYALSYVKEQTIFKKCLKIINN